MKEASGELSMTVVTIIAVVAIALIVTAVSGVAGNFVNNTFDNITGGVIISNLLK